MLGGTPHATHHSPSAGRGLRPTPSRRAHDQQRQIGHTNMTAGKSSESDPARGLTRAQGHGETRPRTKTKETQRENAHFAVGRQGTSSWPNKNPVVSNGLAVRVTSVNTSGRGRVHEVSVSESP